MDRRDRRALARQVLRHSPGLVDKIMDEEKVTRSRAKQLAVRYIAAGLNAQGANQPDAV
jgi:hypothetical protein